jgi:AcrR family transcriptional regulator
MLDSMSSGDPRTRAAILDAARQILEAEPGRPVSMAAVAKAAGVSRQALYLHFRDRTHLFTEALSAVDASLRTPARQRRVDDALTAREALREAVALQAWLKPRLKGIATAIEVLRRTDPAANATWHEREDARLHRCRQVIERLADEGELEPSWSVEDATRWFWALTSQRVWDDLVVEQRISNAQYRETLTTTLEAALLRRPTLEPTSRRQRLRAPRARVADGR